MFLKTWNVTSIKYILAKITINYQKVFNVLYKYMSLKLLTQMFLEEQEGDCNALPMKTCLEETTSTSVNKRYGKQHKLGVSAKFLLANTFQLPLFFLVVTIL